MERLYNKLKAYAKTDYYPMHMPGHKRNTNLVNMENPYSLDITEIDGFDNLHQQEGILKQLSEDLSSLYGAGRSYPLVNGGTAGNLAGISAATNRGDEVLIARNSHKSVYHAVILRGLKPHYIYPHILSKFPQNGGILACEVEEMLITFQKIKLVVITSPTYEGIVSDIKGISEVVHRHGAILLVDEAHGAHFGFHEAFPQSAIRLGADLVIQSLHKTLPALTQSAVLHSNKPELNHKLQRYLAIYESSSPSYVLMAGIDNCIHILKEQSNELFDNYYKNLLEFYHKVAELKNLQIIDKQCIGQNGVYDLDLSKITISLRNSGLTGHQLQEMLREQYHIIMEMAAPEHVLALTSICDTKEGLLRLAEALVAIDKEVNIDENFTNQQVVNSRRPVQVLLPGVALDQNTEIIKLAEGEGRLSAAFVSLYPPGSPILVPGEKIDRELLHYLQWVKKEGFTLTGLIGSQLEEIEVVSETFSS